jgi:HemY protein
MADRPGDVMITWAGYRVQTSVAVAATAIVVTAILLAVVWSVINYLLRLPRRVGRGSRQRRRGKGYAALSRGLVAVGAGDAGAARRHAREAERFLGQDSLTLLLKAQAAQVAGDRPAAEKAFRQMAADSDTRVLGLRGLFIEARRRGDIHTARDYAREAASAAPTAAWASDAVLESHSAEGDWRGAIAHVERRASLGLVDKATARRQRAVLYTADALGRADTDPDGALAAAQEAVKLAPDLVPAAVLAGQILSRRADLRRASKIIEAAWKANPHPDLADAYLGVRAGDSSQDRLRRAETLARLSSWGPESRLALARAALDAREFKQARDVIRPLLSGRVGRRVCLLMAEIEDAEHGPTGRMREWLARATRAPRDAAWIADGVVSDHWAPVSPVTGKLDAFRWEAPPEMITAGSSDILALPDDDAELDSEPEPTPALPAPSGSLVDHSAATSPAAVETPPPLVPDPVETSSPGKVEPVTPPVTSTAVTSPGVTSPPVSSPVVVSPPTAKPPATTAVTEPTLEAVAAAESSVPAAEETSLDRGVPSGGSAISPEPKPEPSSVERPPVERSPAERTPVERHAVPERKPPPASPISAPAKPDAPLSEPPALIDRKPAPRDIAKEAAPVVFPVSHAPDDPGPLPESRDAKRSRFRVFG